MSGPWRTPGTRVGFSDRGDGISGLLEPGWILLAAFGAAVLLRWVDPVRRWGGWIRGEGGIRGRMAHLLDGAVHSPWSPGWEAGLRRSGESRSSTLAFLLGSHAFTPYYLLLLAPLLGTDLLLSHLAGGVLFYLLARAALAPGIWSDGAPRPAPVEKENEPSSEHSALPEGNSALPASEGTASSGAGSPASLLQALVSESRGILVPVLYGLLLVGLAAAWGLTGPELRLAEISHRPWEAQGANALLGAFLAVALVIPPVGNLIPGVVLWEAGLAHAGLVAYFYAAPLSPARIRAYLRILGAERALRLAGALTAGAILSGVATAWLHGLFDLNLPSAALPAQLWR